MRPNQMLLRDAGHREQAFAQSLAALLPNDLKASDLFTHAIYDSHTDEIILTVKAVTYRWKVQTP